MYGFASLWEASASSPWVINPFRRTNYLVYFISYFHVFYLIYIFQIHLVHFKSKYGSIENANKFTDGRAVVAIFYKVILQHMYSRTCLKRLLIKKTKIGFQYRLSLNAGQKYCRMLQGEHSAIRSTFIKLPFSIKTFFVYFKWPLKTGFTI